MGNLSIIGRIFFGISIAVMGPLTIYYRDFPYMLIPYMHSWIPGLGVVAYISGAMLLIAGLSIVSGKKARPVSIVLGTVLLLIFCFYYIPYQLIVSPNYMVFWDWENSAKELALSGGAFVIAGCFAEEDNNPLIKFFSKLIPLGTIIFSITIISFGIDHFMLAKEAAEYVPSWIPWHVFWMYFCGAALLGSGIAIILNIKRRLAATLLGIMTLTWFIILHVPRVIVSPAPYLSSEISSAFLALAYSGVAFVIAGKDHE